MLHSIDFILLFLDFLGSLRNLDLQEVVLFPQRVFSGLEPQVRPDACPHFKGRDRLRDVVDGPYGHYRLCMPVSQLMNTLGVDLKVTDLSEEKSK
ncbi:MAG TPA: hypothetical protein DGF30_05045 [Desulfomicrobium sp.]|nr:hypothetical protein [Desulfomicrobium sp.]